MGPEPLILPPTALPGPKILGLSNIFVNDCAAEQTHRTGIHPHGSEHRNVGLGVHDMVRKIFALALVAGSLMATTACNTVAGAGRDVQSAGKAVEGAAH